MKRSRFTESQIIAILKPAEAGVPVPELFREHGISSVSFFQKAMAKKVVRPSDRKRMVQYAVEHRGSIISLACQLFVVSGYCYRYRHLLSQENQLIAGWLVCITDSYRMVCPSVC